MRSRAQRFAALIMASVMAVSVSSCSVVSDIQSQINTVYTNLSEQELARLVINAIADDTQVSDSFSAIPDPQLDGLTYTAFYEYVSILRSVSSSHGKATSFRILSEEEEDAYFAQATDSDYDVKSLDEYGELDVVEICYEEDDDPLYPCMFVLKERTDGSYSLAGDYIADSIVAYDYVTHYFLMIEEKNTDALSAIIGPIYPESLYISSVISTKADYVIDYYKLKVMSGQEDYKLGFMSPVKVTFVIPETLDNDNVTVKAHKVSLLVGTDGATFIRDIIPSNDGEQLFLCSEGEKLVTCGEKYSAQDVIDIMGDPVSALSDGKVVDSYEDDDGMIHLLYDMVVNFDGVSLKFKVEFEDYSHTEWTGTLESIRIYRDSAYTVSNLVYEGMNLSELMLIYPMIDEFGFVYSYEYEDEDYEMSFTYDENYNITSVIVSEAK
jgi:hypothetical protein